MYATPQSAPRKTGWTIHVTLLIYNQEKPDKKRNPVGISVSEASPPSAGNKSGLSDRFLLSYSKLDQPQKEQTQEENKNNSVSQQLFLEENPEKTQHHSENNGSETPSQKITVSFLVNRLSRQQVPLGADSTILDLKEAIAQKTMIADLTSDKFCLVFDRNPLPDWPTMRSKTLAELGLFDECMVFAVEFDKEQYTLREVLATRLVGAFTHQNQRRRRLENVFDLAQDCMQSAKGFCSFVEEEAYPKLYSSKSSEIDGDMKERDHYYYDVHVHKNREITGFPKHSFITHHLQPTGKEQEQYYFQQQQQSLGVARSATVMRNNNNNNNFSAISPVVAGRRSLLPPVREQNNISVSPEAVRPTSSTSLSVTRHLLDEQTPRDSLLKKKYALREKEEVYRGYDPSESQKRASTMLLSRGGIAEKWLVGNVTSDIE